MSAPAKTAIPVNSMGLPLDTFLPTDLPPSFVLYGPPGVGKSLEAARLGARIFYVQTNPDSLRMAFDLFKRGLFPQPPVHRLTLDETYINRYFGGYYYTAICDLMTRFIASCDAGTSEYDGIVFDEWSTILDRVWMELLADPWGISRNAKGTVNPFAVMDTFRRFHATMISVARRTRKLVGFVSHYQLPVYHDQGPEMGRIKVPGGPKVPANVKGELITLCAEVSVVLEMRAKSGRDAFSDLALPIPGGTPATPEASPAAPAATLTAPTLPGLPAPAAAAPATTADTAAPAQAAPATTPEAPVGESPRVLKTQLEPDWFRKIRGYGVKPEEAVEMGKYGLREILEKAGFPLSRV